MAKKKAAPADAQVSSSEVKNASVEGTAAPFSSDDDEADGDTENETPELTILPHEQEQQSILPEGLVPVLALKTFPSGRYGDKKYSLTAGQTCLIPKDAERHLRQIGYIA